MRHVKSCKNQNLAKPYNGEMQKDMQLPPRALPRRFRQPRLLLAGCGDVAARIAAQVGTRYRLLALLRHEPDSVAWQTWRSLGATPIAADLDQPRSLKRLRGLATHVIYLTPPADSNPTEFYTDARLNGFLAAMQSGGSLPRRLVYIGTSGVYGDCQGALVRESRPCQPKTARGQRRAAAEATLRRWARTRIGAARTTDLANPARKTANAGSILRVPGIYAGDRLPVERLRAGTPALRTEEDTWTNHIHADDLARISWLSLSRSRSLRAYNASDSSTLKMGDWFDAVADAYGLPKPERLARNDLKERVSPMLYSFMSESRRLDNQRLLKELRIQLRYPTVHDFLATLKVPPC
jgi:nucleoside-diphosphate-sugar epimerase